MLIETALMTFLLAQSSVTSLLGSDDNDEPYIHFARAPQEVEAPYIVISKIDAPRDYTHDGASSLARPRFQLSIFAAKYSTCKAIAAAVQAALNGFSCPGLMGGESGVTVQAIFYDDETDLDQGEYGLYGVACDYIITHRE